MISRQQKAIIETCKQKPRYSGEDNEKVYALLENAKQAKTVTNRGLTAWEALEFLVPIVRHLAKAQDGGKK